MSAAGTTRASARRCAGRASICGTPRQLRRTPQTPGCPSWTRGARGSRPQALSCGLSLKRALPRGGRARGCVAPPGHAPQQACPRPPPRPPSSGGCTGDQEPQGAVSGCRVCGPEPAFPGVAGALGFLRPLLQRLPCSAGPSLSLPRPTSPTVGHGEGAEHWPHRTGNKVRGGRSRRSRRPRVSGGRPWGRARVSGTQGLLPSQKDDPACPPEAAPTASFNTDIPPRPSVQSCPPLGGRLVSGRKPPSSQALTFRPEPPRRASMEGAQAGSGLQGGRSPPSAPASDDSATTGPRLHVHWTFTYYGHSVCRDFSGPGEPSAPWVPVCERGGGRPPHGGTGGRVLRAIPPRRPGLRVIEESLTAGDRRARTWPTVWVLRGSSVFYT